MGGVAWKPFRPRRVAKPRPTDTLEATISWVFLKMMQYTGSRMGRYRVFGMSNLDVVRMVLLCHLNIGDAFQLSRSNKWTLKHICFIIDGVHEELHVFCHVNHC